MENLGKLGRDKVTGFEGIIVAKGIHLFGCSSYALSPKAKDGEKKASQWLDVGRIEIIGEGITTEKAKSKKSGDEPTSDNLEKLGKLGRDKVTGFEGIIVAKVINLFGCNNYHLAPKAKDGEEKSLGAFDEGRIEIIGDGITAEEVKSDKPGGIILKSPDNNVF
jgi:hypothetical protein